MKVALAQLNTTVGDISVNERKITDAYRRAVDAGADIVVCPELCVAGYPPRDLVLKKHFVAANFKAVERLAAMTGKTGLLIGYIGVNSSRPGREATNAAALLQNGRVIATRVKTLLPTYDVFDEDRYFQPGKENEPLLFNGRKIGITVCEDLWNDEAYWQERRYDQDPAQKLSAAGAEIIFNLSASPWHDGKNRIRVEMLSSLAQKNRRPIVYANAIGGNDELIFDGSSLVFDAAGKLLAHGKLFDEDLIFVDLEKAAPIEFSIPPREECLFKALVLGLRDYVHKCKFKSAVLD